MRPSETWGMGENVVLTHIWSPLNEKTVSFPQASQAAYPAASNELVYRGSGRKQTPLDTAVQKLFIGRPVA
ncbi:hypothetical protein [Alteromonas sp. ASW11-130]|uniref:hypothetical protein n=1 Tax=Alteromonas sp. ASW11-130 TaxID=3015775 RepID=UPI002242137A|nr:hypothetical protein [Alteromonas sp. ASW11-130]MCW8092944.1 hypothetical protein [Alteromonas sp. ASW11-130]